MTVFEESLMELTTEIHEMLLSLDTVEDAKNTTITNIIDYLEDLASLSSESNEKRKKIYAKVKDIQGLKRLISVSNRVLELSDEDYLHLWQQGEEYMRPVYDFMYRAKAVWFFDDYQTWMLANQSGSVELGQLMWWRKAKGI